MAKINVGDRVVLCQRTRNGSVRKYTNRTTGQVLGTVTRVIEQNNEVEIKGNRGEAFYRTISNYVAPTKVRQDFPSTFTF